MKRLKLAASLMAAALILGCVGCAPSGYRLSDAGLPENNDHLGLAHYYTNNIGKADNPRLALKELNLHIKEKPDALNDDDIHCWHRALKALNEALDENTALKETSKKLDEHYLEIEKIRTQHK